MSKPYIPRAGSLTERLLGALAGSGDAMTTADICQLFKVKSNSLFNLLSPAVKAGMLVKGTNAEGRTIYSLPDGDAPTTAAPKARKAAKKKQRVPTAEAATAEPDVDEVPPPHCRPLRRWRHCAVRHHAQCRRQRLHPERTPGAARAPLPGAGVWPH